MFLSNNQCEHFCVQSQLVATLCTSDPTLTTLYPRCASTGEIQLLYVTGPAKSTMCVDLYFLSYALVNIYSSNHFCECQENAY